MVRLVVREVANIMLDLPADSLLVAGHVSGDHGVALASINDNSLLDGSDDFICHDGQRSNGMGSAFGGMLHLVFTRLALPRNVHDHGPLESKPKIIFAGFIPARKEATTEARFSYYILTKRNKP